MTPEEKAKAQYRFQGYQLPKIQLDSTGPSYYKVGVHPYFRNQPAYWQQQIFSGTPSLVAKTTNPLPSDGSVNENL